MKVVRNISENDGNGANAMFEYNRSKQKYLGLCRRYGLNPFDLDILSLSVCRLPRRDKILIVSLILKLTRLERLMKDMIGDGLFPLTVKESERSGYLVPTRRAAS